MRYRYTISIEIRNPALLNEKLPSQEELAQYIFEAVENWYGQFFPGDSIEREPADSRWAMADARIKVQYQKGKEGKPQYHVIFDPEHTF